MKLANSIETIFKRYLPSPFAIAILLTLFTMMMAMVSIPSPEEGNRFFQVLSYWEKGIWNNDLLVFAYQMMLILVLGHILVLTKPVNKLVNSLTSLATNTQNAVVLVSLTTMLVAFFNWGLGLIFGAIMARKVGEAAQSRGFAINYPIVGAAGYVGLMIWHGGISGSAPAKVSESGHLASLMKGMGSDSLRAKLPDLIAYNETIFSPQNLLMFLVLLICVPLFLRFLAKSAPPTQTDLPIYKGPSNVVDINGKERIDGSKWFGVAIGILVLTAFFVQYATELSNWVITPNMLNFFMLGLALLLHGSFNNFMSALEEAIKGTSGILIQFPLYFGIMGIMRDSGMVVSISNFFVSIANETTLPLFTFLSAGVVNIFVPSGGGQWAIQGPVVVESAMRLGVPLNKAIMALAYGDQITNMLQPFWALPLLGITKLKANEILPYTLLLMFLGAGIFIVGLLLW